MEYKEFIRHYTNILNAGTVTSKGVEKYVRKEVQLIAYGNGISFQKALDDLIDIYFDQSMRNQPGYLQDQSTTAATNLFFIKFMDTHSKEDSMTDTINHDMIDKLAYKGQGISKEDLRTEHEND